jgi:hypothetical protein
VSGRFVWCRKVGSGRTPSAKRQIRDRLAEDPWAADGHLAVGSLERWALWLDVRSRPARTQ